MCKYTSINKGNKSGKPCMYPNFYEKNSSLFSSILPIDKDGFCLFHSNNETWKIENQFEERFFELISVISTKFKDIDKAKWDYRFYGFIFPSNKRLEIKEIPFYNFIDFSSCVFNGGIDFLNLKISSLDIQNTIFEEKVIFKDVIVASNIYSTKSLYENGLVFENCDLSNSYCYFDDCSFNKKENFEIGIKKQSVVKSMSFENSKINLRFSVQDSTISDLNFDNCIFDDEFYIQRSTINGLVSFDKSEFNYVDSGNNFETSISIDCNILTDNGKLVFEGKKPQDNMVKKEISIYFKDTEKPKGLISFKNFNLNKIASDDKNSLLAYEKEGLVEIGEGCKKYYCQTEIFKIDAPKATQKLILDFITVFKNYFDLTESYNLGLEIVERKPDFIRYFYFTDEIITIEQFLEKLNLVEINLWETFSNLSKSIGENHLNIEVKNLMIDISGLFLKLGLFAQSNEIADEKTSEIFNSISAKIVKVNEELKIEMGTSIIETKGLLEKTKSFFKSFPKFNFIFILGSNNAPIQQVGTGKNVKQEITNQ